MKLKNIFIYPIKSVAGIPLTKAQAQEKGLEYDRRWMLIDEKNRFISQRELADMTLLDLKVNQDAMVLQHRTKAMGKLHIPLIPKRGATIEAEVWSDTVKVIWPQSEGDKWFSEILGRSCRLVYMPEDAVRQVDPDYLQRPVNTSLSDGYPFLLANEASLQDLSLKAGLPIEMERFRPNLVVETSVPFIEDHWKKIQIGEAIFEILKPCARCVITTIDPRTSIKGKEPLKTLNTYRKQDNKTLFGQNMILERGGFLQEGDEVIVLEEK